MWSNVAIFLRLLGNQYDFSYASPTKDQYGRDVKADELTFVVSIGYKDSKETEEENHFCSGVLVTKQHVLTAAHCLHQIRADRLQVIVGSADLYAGTKYFVKSWTSFIMWFTDTYHKSPKDPYNDIAVMTVKYLRLLIVQSNNFQIKAKVRL